MQKKSVTIESVSKEKEIKFTEESSITMGGGGGGQSTLGLRVDSQGKLQLSARPRLENKAEAVSVHMIKLKELPAPLN